MKQTGCSQYYKELGNTCLGKLAGQQQGTCGLLLLMPGFSGVSIPLPESSYTCFYLILRALFAAEQRGGKPNCVTVLMIALTCDASKSSCTDSNCRIKQIKIRPLKALQFDAGHTRTKSRTIDGY